MLVNRLLMLCKKIHKEIHFHYEPSVTNEFLLAALANSVEMFVANL
jgi:hypothetical protein